MSETKIEKKASPFGEAIFVGRGGVGLVRLGLLALSPSTPLRLCSGSLRINSVEGLRDKWFIWVCENSEKAYYRYSNKSKISMKSLSAPYTIPGTHHLIPPATQGQADLEIAEIISNIKGICERPKGHLRPE